MTAWPPAPAFMTSSAACLPCHDGFYSTSTVSRNKPSLLEVAFGRGILFQKHNHHQKSRLYNTTTGKLKHLLTFSRTKREPLGQDTQCQSKSISSVKIYCLNFSNVR